jgi:hypothetical protein
MTPSEDHRRPACRLRYAAGLALAVGALAACGGEEPEPTPIGPMAEALASLGGGGEGTIGVGWADPQLVARSGSGAALIEEALGPNAGSVVEAAPRLRAHYGLDPLAAERLVSVGGSYAFGLRLDGVDGRRLASRLVADGGRERMAGDLRLIEIGDYAVVPDALRDLGVSGLGAYDALGPGLAVLAISDRARATLLGESERLLDEASYRAALDCLGDVVAARIVADQHIVSTDLGVDLVAVGVRPESEVLCTLGGSSERAEEVAAAFEATLSPGAHDPITREPIARSVAAVEVESSTYEGVEAVRAELTLTPAEERGYVFGALTRASVVGWINGAPSTFTPRAATPPGRAPARSGA